MNHPSNEKGVENPFSKTTPESNLFLGKEEIITGQLERLLETGFDAEDKEGLNG